MTKTASNLLWCAIVLMLLSGAFNIGALFDAGFTVFCMGICLEPGRHA